MPSEEETVRTPHEYIRADACEWCDAPLPAAGAHHIRSYAPDDGRLYDTTTICEACRTYGPPSSSRRDRVEAAYTIRPQMSRLERLGWALIHYARR